MMMSMQVAWIYTADSEQVGARFKWTHAFITVELSTLSRQDMGSSTRVFSGASI